MRSWAMVAAAGVAFLGIYGCGRTGDGDPQPVHATGDSQVNLKTVVGNAQIGNYCQMGSYAQPQPVPLELVECPIPQNSVELLQPLQAFNLQADCKKKTLDVRSPTRAFEPMTWELMPDGNFYFIMNGGTAVIKDDGAGNLNCNTPLRADVWGRVDCTDPIKPIIRTEVVWWIGQTPDVGPSGIPSGLPSPVPSPTPTASPTPTVTPTSTPTVTPSGTPTITPIPTPIASSSSTPSNPSDSGHSWFPFPFPLPFPTHRVAETMPYPPIGSAPGPAASATPGITGPTCKFSPKCYFHTMVRFDQCS